MAARTRSALLAIARETFMQAARDTSCTAPLEELQRAYVRAAARVYDALGLPYECERVSRAAFLDVQRELESTYENLSFDRFCRLVAAHGRETETR